MNKKLIFTKEELLELINKYKSFEISQIKKCSINTIKNYLKKFNIKTPPGFYISGKPDGRKNNKGLSLETRKILSIKFKGIGNPFYGKKHSIKTKEKMKMNHADFIGDNNPFKKACKKNPEIIKRCSKIKQKEWDKLSIEERYLRTKKCICGDISINHWTRIINNAKSRNIEFNITPEYIWNLFLIQQSKCALSDINLNLKSCYEVTASLDRIDSLKGYTKDNVQWIHKELNWMKNSMSNEKFIWWCNNVSKKFIR